MDSSSINNIPWELIIASFEGSLSGQEQAQLQHWLASGVENPGTYDRIRQLWKEDLTGYAYYKAANENEAWKALRSRLGSEPKIVQMGGKQRFIKWGSIAAAVIIAVSAGLLWLINQKTDMTIYHTAMNEKKQFILPDSSTVLLEPQSEIAISKDFDKTNRTIILKEGEAFFDVKHKALPFIVDMGISSVKDIGTSFTIRKGTDSIMVTVVTGKVAFIKNATKETLELSEGMTVSSDSKEGNFGKIASKVSLRFRNTALSDVVVALEKAYGKRIVLENSSMANTRLGAQLDGVDFERALKIICTSLDLEYTIKDNVYILREKK